MFAAGFLSFYLLDYFSKRNFLNRTFQVTPARGFKTVSPNIGYWNLRGMYGRNVNEGLTFS